MKIEKRLILAQLNQLHKELLERVKAIEELQRAIPINRVWKQEDINRIEGLRRDVLMLKDQEKKIIKSIL